jgi:hypothetical protein
MLTTKKHFPVVKPNTIRIVLSTDISSNWPIYLDVNNAFLHGSLQETIYYQRKHLALRIPTYLIMSVNLTNLFMA